MKGERDEMDRFRVRLTGMKSELEELEADSGDSTRTVELDQPAVGRLSRMDALQGQAMALETARRRRQRIQAIEGALRRLDSGDFGFCFKCGEGIDIRRLEVDPTNTRCIRCSEGA